MKGKILVTGGTGYIGSHTVVELHAAGYEVVVIDKRHKKVRLITVGGQARDGMDDDPGELTDERVISYERR